MCNTETFPVLLSPPTLRRLCCCDVRLKLIFMTRLIKLLMEDKVTAIQKRRRFIGMFLVNERQRRTKERRFVKFVIVVMEFCLPFRHVSSSGIWKKGNRRHRIAIVSIKVRKIKTTSRPRPQFTRSRARESTTGVWVVAAAGHRGN